MAPELLISIFLYIDKKETKEVHIFQRFRLSSHADILLVV